MDRRDFLRNTGLVLGAGLLSQVGELVAAPIAQADWRGLRRLFPLVQNKTHLATFLLASHPRPVTEAIATHRQLFDANPADYWHSKFLTIDGQVADAAAQYMGVQGHQVALTDSTTMGLGLLYSGLKLNPGDEILQTTHDHYSTDMSIAWRARRTGVAVRQVALYDSPAAVNVDQVLARMSDAIGPATRVFAATWVHSSTGVKLPIAAMAEKLANINKTRAAKAQILFCVDGVHGFGIENQNIAELGCDFFVAGTHKWIFGPRGTGVIWGSDKGWAQCDPVIPSFSASYEVWLGNMNQSDVPVGEHMTPGGFHSFEHRWALPEAFRLHMQLGKKSVQERIHALNRQTKEGLAKLKHVTLYTPKSEQLSSGLVCFDVQGMAPDAVVETLHKQGIIMSSTPYRQSYARFAPSLLNTEQEIDQAVAAIAALG